MRDNLNIPLQRRSFGNHLWEKRPSALALCYVLTIVGYAGAATWSIQQELPFAGEPVVISAVPPPKEIKEILTASIEPVIEAVEPVASTPEPTPEDYDAMTVGPETPVPDVPFADEGVEQVGRKKKPTITIQEPVKQDTYKQGEAIIYSARRALSAAPNAAISEKTPDGLLPKIGAGNQLAMNIYARRTPMSVVHSSSPKIAIVLGGMGLNTKLTQKAIKDLPADVTLAFAPYGEGLQPQVNAARKEGHEVFLQVPMEPIGFPAANPGPKTLLEDNPPEENLSALHWHMTRFSGYAGVLNYMGGKFLKNPDDAKFVLEELRRRGLYFLEDGSVQGSATSDVAVVIRAKAKTANRVIDANPTAAAINAVLQELEVEAQQNGIAIGTGSGLAITIDTIAEWAKEASERGIILVPISASYSGRLG